MKGRKGNRKQEFRNGGKRQESKEGKGKDERKMAGVRGE